MIDEHVSADEARRKTSYVDVWHILVKTDVGCKKTPSVGPIVSQPRNHLVNSGCIWHRCKNVLEK